MEFLLDFLNTASVYKEGYCKGELDTLNRIELLNDSVGTTISQINQLNNSLLAFNRSIISIAVFSSPVVFNSPSTKLETSNDIDKIRALVDENETTNKEHPRKERWEFNVVNVLEKVSGFSQSAETCLDAFNELPAGIEKFKKGLDFLPGLNDTVNGFTDLSSAAKTGGIAEELLAGSEIMAGAGAVAEAGAAFGPPGWIIGVGALVAGGIATIAAGSSEKELTSFDDLSADKMKKFYYEKERQNDYEKLIGSGHVENYRQLDAINEELDKDYMVADREKRVNRALEAQKISFPDLYTKYGSRNLSQVMTGTSINDTIKKAFFQHPPEELSARLKLAEQAEEIKAVAKFNSMGGKVDYAKVDRQIAELCKRNQFKKKPPKTTTLSYRLPTEGEWDSYVRDEIGLPQIPAKSSLNARRSAQHGHSLSGSTRQGAVININLNKPMIENFTINTRDTKEAISDFKHKVEDALIEILNSANAI